MTHRQTSWRRARWLLVWACFASPVATAAQDALPMGEIVPRVSVPTDSAQTYAIYVPRAAGR